MTKYYANPQLIVIGTEPVTDRLADYNKQVNVRDQKQTSIVCVAFAAPSSAEATITTPSAAWWTVIRLSTKSAQYTVHNQLR